jgi:poly-gamma-glutamate capsule biosynthesis protein CapA/YwtB (metallophosphatase superfamily)
MIRCLTAHSVIHTPARLFHCYTSNIRFIPLHALILYEGIAIAYTQYRCIIQSSLPSNPNMSTTTSNDNTSTSSTSTGGGITLFLSGDVMTGRGIDQILPNHCHPIIYEGYCKSAKQYVELAEKVNGKIPRNVDSTYIWGDALNHLKGINPDLRIINLETSVTTSSEWWKGKGINYRMHPKNINVLTAASIDCCVLSNNHVLDWGYDGLLETLDTIKAAGMKQVGAGRDLQEAIQPAIFNLTDKNKGTVAVYGMGNESSGIPESWCATPEKAGVNFLHSLSTKTVDSIAEQSKSLRRNNTRLIASIHWGNNWGYQIPSTHRQFAHSLIDVGGFDIVHGHSSHHMRGIELYKGKLIFYGCGDFINDYEGIR